MPKNKCSNSRNKRKEDTLIPTKEHNNISTLECEDEEINEIQEMNSKD